MNVAVSIIVPVFNAEKSLRTALHSLCNQTLTNIEIICIDDGSTDSSNAILREFSQRDSRISVINQKNSGAAAARNAGMDVAHGEYIYFVDSDDWAEPCLCERAYRLAKDNSADIAFILNAHPEYFGFQHDEIIPHVGISVVERLYSLNLYALWNTMYRIGFLKQNELRLNPLHRIAEDQAMLYRAMIHAPNIVIVAQKLYHYTIDNFSLTRTQSPSNNGFDIFSAHQEVKAYIRNKHLWDAWKDVILRQMLKQEIDLYTLYPRKLRKRWIEEKEKTWDKDEFSYISGGKLTFLQHLFYTNPLNIISIVHILRVAKLKSAIPLRRIKHRFSI